MAGKGDERQKAIVGVITNILNTINEDDIEDNENVTSSATPRRSDLPPPHGSVTASRERGASTSTAEEAPPTVKKLLEEWLTTTLNNILDKPVQRANRNAAPTDTTAAVGEQPAPPTGNTHTVVDIGNDALAAILRKMEEIKNENK